MITIHVINRFPVLVNLVSLSMHELQIVLLSRNALEHRWCSAVRRLFVFLFGGVCISFDIFSLYVSWFEPSPCLQDS